MEQLDLTENKLAAKTEPRGIESVKSVNNYNIRITGHPNIPLM